MTVEFFVREAVRDDCAELVYMMRELAAFEGYLDQFAVTKAALLDRGFSKQDFKVVVVESSQQKLLGMLVYYFLPFTYDLKPWMFIKELYVKSEYRGLRIGNALMSDAVRLCEFYGGNKIVWDVLADNIGAQRFYQRLGAKHDDRWQAYYLEV